jgi:hypothetical protein
MLLELILRAADVPEPLRRIRAQGETEARPVRRMHHAVRRMSNGSSKSSHIIGMWPLAHPEDVAVGGGHRNVNAGGEQNTTAPGMWG